MEGNREFLLHLTPAGRERTRLTWRHIQRVGLVAKHHLDAAAGVLAELAGWLEARGRPRGLRDRDRGAGRACRLDARRSAATICRQPAISSLVLGGDGTLIGMAGRIARSGADVPILGVNFGSLGFLTEITLDELYDSLEAVLEGHAHLETRMMLRARTLRQGKRARRSRSRSTTS